MNVLLCLSHSIEEYDQLRLLDGLGYSVASIGGYIDPAHPHDPKRPALPDVPMVPEIKAAVDGLGAPDNLAAAQARLPDVVLEWADVIVFHHYLERLFGQWDRIEQWRAGGSHRRVVWRTVGQSGPANEAAARPFRDRGLEVVRYSPRERFIPGYVGHDALIRFWKDPDEWQGWHGDPEADEAFLMNVARPDPYALTVAQGLAQRDPWTNWGYWERVTYGLPRLVIGPGTDILEEGIGEVPVERMRAALRAARVYLYTGTQPASYTLGLIEALMTGTPVVCIGRRHFNLFDWGPAVFEAPDLVGGGHDLPGDARLEVEWYLSHSPDLEASAVQRARIIGQFGPETVGADWRRFLGRR